MLFRLGAAVAVFAIGAAGQDTTLDHFEKKVRPALAAHCYVCHSESATAPQGGLLLDSTRGIQKGGKSGPAIQPDDPEHSLLLRAIRYQDKNLKMPPGTPLPEEIVADFEAWNSPGRAPSRRASGGGQDPARAVVTPKAPVAGAARGARSAMDTQRHRSLHLEPTGGRRPRTVA